MHSYPHSCCIKAGNSLGQGVALSFMTTLRRSIFCSKARAAAANLIITIIIIITINIDYVCLTIPRPPELGGALLAGGGDPFCFLPEEAATGLPCGGTPPRIPTEEAMPPLFGLAPVAGNMTAFLAAGY